MTHSPQNEQPPIRPDFEPHELPWHAEGRTPTDQELDKFFGDPQQADSLRPLIRSPYTAWAAVQEAEQNLTLLPQEQTHEFDGVPIILMQVASIMGEAKQAPDGSGLIMPSKLPPELTAGSWRPSLESTGPAIAVGMAEEPEQQALTDAASFGQPQQPTAPATYPEQAAPEAAEVPTWAQPTSTPANPLALEGARVVQRLPAEERRPSWSREAQTEELPKRHGRFLALLERWGLIVTEDSDDFEAAAAPAEEVFETHQEEATARRGLFRWIRRRH